MANSITRYTWGGGCNDCEERILIMTLKLYPLIRFHCPFCGSQNTNLYTIDQCRVIAADGEDQNE